MTYPRIQIVPKVDASIRELVERRVDLYLSDVHAMLRLPLSEAGIDAGCNFAIAATLCSVVDGLSRIFLVTTKGAGEAFRNVLAEASAKTNSTSWKVMRDQLGSARRSNLTDAHISSA